jgi:serine/threonine protein kinase/tetratricopeptide (TPR) repeat protein
MPARTEESIFIEALEHSAPAECAAFLDATCGDDVALRSRVEKLLCSHHTARGFLQAPLPVAEEPPAVAERPGSVVGHYKLIEQIGEGGFGVVFMAEQTHPVRRTVALKVLKPGMDTRQVIARFEAERQALALMDHPNIAHVLDAGETASGRPHFVMELVRGIPITEFCDQNELTLRARLELFATVCLAIQHSHHKGVIHRDIKPTNVLVTLHDGVPVVKVIDFGIAKAIGPQQLTEKTLLTGFAQMIGTPTYMSPEQAEMSGLDIDTRSDIYSLGVLLYELMTGTTPFEKERVKSASYDELRRMIREEEPPRPSTRLSTLGLAASTLATRRSSDPRRLSQLLQGELDWIVMKALEKDRTRRYETASAFAADVQHYLADEPVTACPPSGWYRFRKLARRRRSAFVLAGVVAIALVAVIATAAGSIGWALSDRASRETGLDREVDRILDEAGPPLEKTNWAEATAVLTRAQKLLEAAGRRQAPPRLRELQNDLAMALRLEQITARAITVNSELTLFQGKDRWLSEQIDRGFTQAFQDYGIDLTTLPIDRAAERIRSRSIRSELTRVLDFWWGSKRLSKEIGNPDWKNLLAIAKEGDADPWRNQMRDAVTNVDRHKLEELAASPKVQHESGTTQLLLAMKLQEVGALEEALAVLKNGQEQYPGDPVINDSLGWLYSEIKPPNEPEAIRFLTAALAIDPGRWQTWRKRALVYSNSKKIDLAIADFSQAIRLNPQFADLMLSRAGEFASQKRWNKSLEDLNRAIELDSSMWGAFNNRGVDLEQLQQWELAVADYSKAIDLEPLARKPRENRCRLFVFLGKWDKAASDCNHLVNRPPLADFDYATLASCRLLASDAKGYRDACALMRDRVNEIKNDEVMALLCALACSLTPAAPDDANFALQLAEWNIAKPVNPTYIYHKIAQTAAWYRLGRIELAIRQFESIQRSWPEAQLTSKTANFGPLLCWLFLAQANQRLDRYEAAQHWLEKAEQRMHEGECDGAQAPMSRNRYYWPMCLVLRRDARKLLSESGVKD